jgi:tellurite methyltransferase
MSHFSFENDPKGLALQAFESVDIYLLDLILKGRIRPGMKVLDVGCGHGRNALGLMALGCDVHGFDPSATAIEQLKATLPEEARTRFQVGSLPNTLNIGNDFDWLICNAVFHFAPERESFHRWFDASVSYLKPSGSFFARLSTQVAWPKGAASPFPFLASEEDLCQAEDRHRAFRIEPLKTTVVEKLRTMSTWVLSFNDD